MDETKQANFRLKQETVDEFREYCERNGVSQSQGFDHIMQVVKLNEAKEAIPHRKTEIESFEMHAKALNEAFLRSLELAEETSARVREEFKTELDEKEKALAAEKAQADKLSQEIDKLKKDQSGIEKVAITSQKDAIQARKEADAAQALSEEKEQSNRLLSDRLTKAEKELEKAENRISADADIISKQEKELKNLKEQLDASGRKLADIQKEADNKSAVAAKEAELHEMKALEDLRSNMNETIQKLREEKAGLQAQISILSAKT